MKYEIKINDIVISQENIIKIDFNLDQKTNDSYANDKNRVKVCVDGYIFVEDKIIPSLIKIKDEYVTVSLVLEDKVYVFPKMYIYSLRQSFSNGSGIFYLTLYQKFIGEEKELSINENSNK